jgi:2-keto-4-pentenoate hydratase/2-oxohepta-3-ene-1,7-dioic acid hydratase in catechol pathway
MRSHRLLAPLCALLLAGAALAQAPEKKESQKFCRFRTGKTTAYGLVEGDQVRQLEGNLFAKWSKTDKTYPLSEVRLLPPTTPSKVLAMAGNYKSHLKDAEIPEKFKIPQPFLKTPSCLIGNGRNVVIPKGTAEVHYEAEMVIVIGKRCRNVSKEDAPKYVFGVTCGNDISARDWQKNDVQWWRAKGSDTFGPCGPFIVTGLDYDNLMLQLRHNGKVVQKASTKDLIHDVATCVSFISQEMTLRPGDLIFTGTSGQTKAIHPGDVLEVELEGVGILRNKVVKEK